MATDKDALRQLLATAADAFQGEIVRYAAVAPPERKPWKKRPTPLDEAYQRALNEADAQQDEKH